LVPTLAPFRGVGPVVAVFRDLGLASLPSLGLVLLRAGQPQTMGGGSMVRERCSVRLKHGDGVRLLMGAVNADEDLRWRTARGKHLRRVLPRGRLLAGRA
jgi:hypothetical protein